MGKVVLYGILHERAGVKEIEVKTSGRKVIDIIKDISNRYNLDEILFKEGKIRPVFLIMIDGQDYLSLGLIEKVLDGEKEIKIIPVYHGGYKNLKRIIIAVIIILIFFATIVLKFIS